MARKRRDKKPPRLPDRRRLTEFYVKDQVRPEAEPYNIRDTEFPGIHLRVYPSGQKTYKALYRHKGRVRWATLGNANGITLKQARALGTAVKAKAAGPDGIDVVAEAKAKREAGTFGELADQYLERHAKKENKSWGQARKLIESNALPKWGRLRASAITAEDVERLLAPMTNSVHNQVVASLSAIFSWATKKRLLAVNPCRGIDRKKMRARSRILHDSEFPKFWQAFGVAGAAGAALKVMLLTGQRPGEVCRMFREHVIDGWWELPGDRVPELAWPGTKNGKDHNVWLSRPVLAIMADLDASSGFVFATRRGAALPIPSPLMKTIYRQMGITDKITPHDLRRTFCSLVTRLGFGRDAMNRVTNHIEGGIADVYDRYEYRDENKNIMERVAARIVDLAEGRDPDANVIGFRKVP
jgi:integrase